MAGIFDSFVDQPSACISTYLGRSSIVAHRPHLYRPSRSPVSLYWSNDPPTVKGRYLTTHICIQRLAAFTALVDATCSNVGQNVSHRRKYSTSMAK